jgi:hypothetical protein
MTSAKRGHKDKNFGERVRVPKKERGLSQRKLATQAGIDFTYLSKIDLCTKVQERSWPE